MAAHTLSPYTRSGRPGKDGQEHEHKAYKPSRVTFTKIHITSDDIALRPRLPSQHVSTPRKIAQRDTWPSKGVKPGSLSFDEIPTLVRTPWEVERGRRQQPQRSRHRQKVSKLPAHIFEHLPAEIYHCILDHLEGSHIQSHTIRVSEYQSDLRSLCLVDKRWHRLAREHLYRHLWLPFETMPAKRRFSLLRSQSRLNLLLSTLKHSEQIAHTVRRITRYPAGETATDTVQERRGQQICQILEFCPYVEQICGVEPVSDNLYEQYCRVLATMKRLRVRSWTFSSSRGLPTTAIDFLNIHQGWAMLETLILRKEADSQDFTPGYLAAVLHRLPSLQHLMLEGFGSDEFHDGSLLSVRPLKSLRLDSMEGISDRGLEQLSRTRSGASLESLSLINLGLSSLHTISTMLARLIRLRKLRLVQTDCPTLPVGIDPIAGHLSLSSSNLEYFHWDTIIPGPALSVLARSIESGKLPHLRTLKAPCDYDGELQALCRPIFQQQITSDDLRFLRSGDPDRWQRDLRLSRLQAQLRVRESRQQPSFNVVIEDQDEQSQQTHVIGSYLGDMRSMIAYSLEPDVDGADEALASFETVMQQKPRDGLNAKVKASIMDVRLLF